MNIEENFEVNEHLHTSLAIETITKISGECININVKEITKDNTCRVKKEKILYSIKIEKIISESMESVCVSHINNEGKADCFYSISDLSGYKKFHDQLIDNVDINDRITLFDKIFIHIDILPIMINNILSFLI